VDMQFPPQVIPKADAGPDRIVHVGDAIRFDGSNSTPHSTLKYAWDFNYTYDLHLSIDSNSEKPYASFPVPGIYTVLLIVFNGPLFDVDTAQVIVKEKENTPPVAKIKTDKMQVTSGSTVNFDASESYDPDGDTLKYYWLFGDGASSEGEVASHTFKYEGIYNVILSVSDGIHTSTASINITVSGIDHAPVAKCGNDLTINEGETVYLDASNSYDIDGDTLTYEWWVSDGRSLKGEYASLNFSKYGTYFVILNVSDGSKKSSDTMKIYVNDINQPPTAKFNITNGMNGMFNITDNLWMDASASYDPDGDILTYIWDFGDGTTGTGKMVSHKYSISGSYMIVLMASDGEYTSYTKRYATIVTRDDYPVAVLKGDITTLSGVETTLNGSLSFDPKNRTMTYTWDFGDGSTSTGKSVKHVFETGIYTVKLTVFNGLLSSYTEITVTANNTAPVASILTPAYNSSFNEDTPISFTSNSTDVNNDVLTITWNFGNGNTLTGKSVTYTYELPGNYTVVMIASDGEFSSSVSMPIRIKDINDSPSVKTSVSPISAFTGDYFTFTSTGTSDEDGDPLNYTWHFPDGSIVYGPSSTRNFTSPGTYQVMLVVSDGKTSSDSTITVTVNKRNTPPVADAGTDITSTAGETFYLSANGSFDADGDPITYSWNMGDGNTSSGKVIDYAYAVKGNYTATLTVKDTSGATSTDTVNINVLPNHKLKITSSKMDIELNPGDSDNITLYVNNIGGAAEDVNIEYAYTIGFENISSISISNKSFTVLPDKSVAINMMITAPEHAYPQKSDITIYANSSSARTSEDIGITITEKHTVSIFAPEMNNEKTGIVFQNISIVNDGNVQENCTVIIIGELGGYAEYTSYVNLPAYSNITFTVKYNFPPTTSASTYTGIIEISSKYIDTEKSIDVSIIKEDKKSPGFGLIAISLAIGIVIYIGNRYKY